MAVVLGVAVVRVVIKMYDGIKKFKLETFFQKKKHQKIQKYTWYTNIWRIYIIYKK